MIPNPPLCTTITISANNLKESVKDPALASLIHSGWTIVGILALKDEFDVKVEIVLAPPIPTPIRREIMMVLCLITVGVWANAILFWSSL